MIGDTIFALSSGLPPAGIAVVRISGPHARETLCALAGTIPPARTARLVTLRDRDGELLDRAMVIWLPGPGTTTGEDVAELHLHGGRAIVAAVSATLAGRPGLRLAEAGEFTRRAMENGRLDLTEADGLADLLAAETEAQRRNALALASGTLSRRIEGWRVRLLAASAAVEAVLDFSEEDDVAELPDLTDLAAIGTEISAMLAVPAVERLRDGVRVVIAGPPNVGKSTLLNALVERDAAITSSVPGTTRDVVEVPANISGLPFLLCDTAGLRETSDPIEKIGVSRAEAEMTQADILLWLDTGPSAHPNTVRVFAQCDVRNDTPSHDAVIVSAVTGAGMEELRSVLLANAAGLLPRASEIALNTRQRAHLAAAGEGIALASRESDLLLIGEGIRIARGAFDRLTGRTGADDMLDALFGRFCIGK